MTPRPNVDSGSTGTSSTLGSPCHRAESVYRAGLWSTACWSFVTARPPGPLTAATPDSPIFRSTAKVNDVRDSWPRSSPGFQMRRPQRCSRARCDVLDRRANWRDSAIGRRSTTTSPNGTTASSRGRERPTFARRSPIGRSGQPRPEPESRSTTLRGAPIVLRAAGGARWHGDAFCPRPLAAHPGCSVVRVPGDRRQSVDAAAGQHQRPRLRARGARHRAVEPEHGFTTWGRRSRLRCEGQ